MMMARTAKRGRDTSRQVAWGGQTLSGSLGQRGQARSTTTAPTSAVPACDRTTRDGAAINRHSG
jgi:hypothetical protein